MSDSTVAPHNAQKNYYFRNRDEILESKRILYYKQQLATKLYNKNRKQIRLDYQIQYETVYVDEIAIYFD